MGKPTVEPIVFTRGYDKFRSTLKETNGRGRNSIITIKKIGNGKAVSEIRLRSISPESEERLFKLVSQNWWMEFKRTNAGDNTIHAELLKEFKYLVAQGMDETYALRAAIELNHSDHKFTMQNLFAEFTSTGTSFLYDNKGHSNFERFIELAVGFNVEIAKRVIISAGSNRLRLDDLYSSVCALEANSKAVEYIPEMESLQLKNFMFFRRFINIRHNSNDLAIAKLISEIPEKQCEIIEVQFDRINQDLSIIEYIDERDVSLWLSMDCVRGMTQLMERCVSARSMVDWSRLLCILMSRYSLRVLIDALEVLSNDTTRTFSKDVVSLVNIANFLEVGGSPETPMAWMLALSEPVAGSSDDETYDLESIEY